MKKDGKRPKPPRPYVDPVEVPELNRLPPGWSGTRIEPDDDEPARESPSRQSVARFAGDLQSAAIYVLQRAPHIRTGQALRAEMARHANVRAALEFSDPDTVDRLLAGIVKIFKLGRSAK